MQVVHAISTSATDLMGVTTALREVLAAQAEAGLDVCLIAQGEWPGALDARVRRVECALRDFPAALARLAGDRAIVHSHVPWRAPALAPLLIRRRRRAFVHSPHGSFAPAALAVHARRKAIVWPLFGGAIRRNDLFVVNSGAEAHELTAKRLGPVVEIAHPLSIVEPPAGMASDRRTVAFLGRIHPIKGVRELVEAWLALGAQSAGWTLRVSGPIEDESYAAAIRALANGRADIAFDPAVSPAGRWAYLAEADVVAVPSKSENFCYVVAEALAMRTPVLTTLGVPWPQIERDGLGWRGDGSAEGLRELLGRALASTPAERAAMGDRGHAHVAATLGARPVGLRYAEVYAGLAATRA